MPCSVELRYQFIVIRLLCLGRSNTNNKTIPLDIDSMLNKRQMPCIRNAACSIVRHPESHRLLVYVASTYSRSFVSPSRSPASMLQCSTCSVQRLDIDRGNGWNDRWGSAEKIIKSASLKKAMQILVETYGGIAAAESGGKECADTSHGT